MEATLEGAPEGSATEGKLIATVLTGSSTRCPELSSWRSANRIWSGTSAFPNIPSLCRPAFRWSGVEPISSRGMRRSSERHTYRGRLRTRRVNWKLGLQQTQNHRSRTCGAPTAQAGTTVYRNRNPILVSACTTCTPPCNNSPRTFSRNMNCTSSSRATRRISENRPDSTCFSPTPPPMVECPGHGQLAVRASTPPGKGALVDGTHVTDQSGGRKISARHAGTQDRLRERIYLAVPGALTQDVVAGEGHCPGPRKEVQV